MRPGFRRLGGLGELSSLGRVQASALCFMSGSVGYSISWGVFLSLSFLFFHFGLGACKV